MRIPVAHAKKLERRVNAWKKSGQQGSDRERAKAPREEQQAGSTPVVEATLQQAAIA